ncbi:hypothetical protein EAT49_18720 [Histidinibacterium lentulum]|uniref:Uncharacterized protein n=2 Tax=Histidinibacterium lentulum TaxID=2480588 RepID=A0A3N2QMN3_9RHOB|nr:hypothetical protein EAT49_18720 [Histidinibacterium lentulum]
MLREEEGELVLSRPGRDRLDVCAATALPDAARARVAQQVRQDLWRALRRVRGFSPVVRVRREAGGLSLVAGGQVDGAVPRGLAARIALVLEDGGNRARWVARARRTRR